VLFIGVVNGALPVIQVSPFWQQAISGAVILISVAVNARSERRVGRQILQRQGATA
jgi:rhamnose transport system permease protein